MTIQHEVATFKALMERLRTAYPEIDEDTLFDTTDGETDLTDAINRAMRRVELDGCLIQGINDWQKELAERKARLGERQDRMKAQVLWAMEEVGKKKLELPDMTLSARRGTSTVIVTDEAALPSEYQRVSYSPDKTKIKEALDAGNAVPGAEWSNATTSLSVRKK